MSQTERNQFLALIQQKKKELEGKQKESLSFLQDAGIVNKQGKLRKEYKNLCIPQDQG
jgi:hypothetical protein